MTGLQQIDIQNVLTEESERGLYKSEQSPLDCSYLSKPMIEGVNRYIDRYNNNDERRRYAGLNYPTAEQAAFAAQEAAELPCTKGIHELKGVSKKIYADHQARMFSRYRKVSAPLSSKQFWEGRKEGLGLHERAKLDSQQRQWQILIRFAFCNSEDLFERLSLLEEVEAFVWLAEAELNEQRKTNRSESGLAVKRMLSQYKITINDERQAICHAMLGLLRGVSETHDMSRDGRVVSHVLPLLKTMGMVALDDSLPVELEQSLNEERFSQLVTMIEKYGDQKVRTQLRQLSLFCKQEGMFQLVPELVDNSLRMIPQLLSSHLTVNPPRWPTWLFQSARICLNFFDMAAFYRFTKLQQSVERLPRLMMGDLNQYSEAIRILESVEQQFNSELQRIEAARPKGIWKWFYSDATTFFDQWKNFVNKERKKLFPYKQAMAENIVSAVKHDLSTHSFNLTPTLHAKFSSYLVNWFAENISSTNGEERQEKAQKKDVTALDVNSEKSREMLSQYHEATDFVSRLLESIEDRNYFPLYPQAVGDQIIYRPDASRVETVMKCYSRLLPEDVARAIQMIGYLIQGEYYPEKNEFNQQLDVLFKGPNQVALKNAFILTLIDRYVMKNITDVDSPAFKFVQSFEPSLAKQWFESSLEADEVEHMQSHISQIMTDIEKMQFSEVAEKFEYISQRLNFYRKNHPRRHDQLYEMTNNLLCSIKEVLKKFIKESPQAISVFEREVMFRVNAVYFQDALKDLLMNAQDIYYFEHDLQEKLVRVLNGEEINMLVDDLQKFELAREGFCLSTKTTIAVLICRLEMNDAIQDDFKQALAAFKRLMMSETDRPEEDKKIINSLRFDSSTGVQDTSDNSENDNDDINDDSHLQDNHFEDADTVIQSIANNYVQVLEAYKHGININDDLWLEMEGFYQLENDQSVLFNHPFLKIFPNCLERYRQSANPYSVVTSLEHTFKHLPLSRSDYSSIVRKRMGCDANGDNTERNYSSHTKRLICSPSLRRS